MENETVWLTQAQMAELFQKDRTVISRHIRNVFNEGELEEQSTCAKFAHMGNDGLQQYETVMYNLDVIISVGYRVNRRDSLSPRRQHQRPRQEMVRLQPHGDAHQRTSAKNALVEYNNLIFGS